MDRCIKCKSQAYFYGIQTKPTFTRWLVCYDCRAVKSGSGDMNTYIYMLDTGLIGSTQKAPSKGLFNTGRATKEEND